MPIYLLCFISCDILLIENYNAAAAAAAASKNDIAQTEANLPSKTCLALLTYLEVSKKKIFINYSRRSIDIKLNNVSASRTFYMEHDTEYGLAES